ncbi:hypothetical protein CCACVL1_03383 [Corchorus capsularis]|uniref:Uncharacterized protein n=1 Tax=Corchorus capsularis TaxID=210143 RepID=A0A1R3JZN6_COCAP|nr:hypothetical protein CCACVL1_03383 [Corchorus capsularis]
MDPSRSLPGYQEMIRWNSQSTNGVT